MFSIIQMNKKKKNGSWFNEESFVYGLWSIEQ